MTTLLINTLLQSVVADTIPTEQLNQLTESTIALAEAAANFGALKVIFGIFLVFIIIILLLFFWQLVGTQKKISDIHISSTKIESYFNETSNRTVGYNQANVLIRRVFTSLAQSVKYSIIRTRFENHLDQKEFTTNKITRVVTYEWNEMVSFLNNFDYNGHALSDLISPDDAKMVIDFMTEQVYLDKSLYTISSMDQATELLINSIKQMVLQELSE